jgi:Peptidase M50B-like
VGAPSLHDDLQQIGEFQGRLPGPVTVLIGVAAAVVVFLPAAWAASRYLYTIAHEGGHALMGSATGRRITSVTMKRDGSGLTTSAGPPGLSVFLFQFFGYLGPSALGLGAAKLIEVGHIIAVLWLLLLALAALLVSARGSLARICILCTGLLLYVAVRYALLGVQVVIAYVLTWFLLISGVAVVLKQWRADGGDHDLLSSTTHLPRGLWSPLWFIGSVAALLAGAALLV